MFVIIKTVNGLYMHAGGLLWTVGMLSDAVVAVVDTAWTFTFSITSQI